MIKSSFSSRMFASTSYVTMLVATLIIVILTNYSCLVNTKPADVSRLSEQAQNSLSDDKAPLSPQKVTDKATQSPQKITTDKKITDKSSLGTQDESDYEDSLASNNGSMTIVSSGESDDQDEYEEVDDDGSDGDDYAANDCDGDCVQIGQDQDSSPTTTALSIISSISTILTKDDGTKVRTKRDTSPFYSGDNAQAGRHRPQSKSAYSNESDDAVTVEDLFGNLVKVERNRVAVVGSSARDMGMFALKAMLLGPLIGVTLKGALIRGLVWAMITYGIHLMWPALLVKLGLGSGLVGFARQLQPEYAQLLMPHLVNLPATIQQLLPKSVTQVTNQYLKAFSPVLDSISSIPDEACRHRAVCEAADHLIRNSPFMSNSLQRISATVYVNFGSEYSKAWLDGIVQSDCGAKYAQCATSPFSNMASKLAEALANSRNNFNTTDAPF